MTSENKYAEDEKALIEKSYQYENAINKGNFNDWLSLWTENGIQLPPNTDFNVGKEEIAKVYEQIFAEMDLEIKIKKIDKLEVHDTIALVVSHYFLRATPKKGGETITIEPDGKALSVYEKQPDKSWKIKYDCFNTNIK